MALPALLRNSLSIPAVGAPLFIVSNPDLVIEQCKAGIVGAFPALNARPKEMLETWLQRITTELADYKKKHPGRKVAPFAVNQIVHSSNDRLAHDVELCEKYKVPIQITSLRAPDDVVKSAKRYGCLVFHDVTNVESRQARPAGGRRRPDPGLRRRRRPCRARCRPSPWCPKCANSTTAACCSRARSPTAPASSPRRRSAPTSPISARASSPPRKPMPPMPTSSASSSSAGEEIVYTNLFTGVHGNYLKKSIAAAGLDPDDLPVADKSKMNFGSGGNSKAKAWRDIWGAGQGVGQIFDAPPAAEIVARLKAEYEAARAALLAGETVPTRLKEAAE